MLHKRSLVSVMAALGLFALVNRAQPAALEDNEAENTPRKAPPNVETARDRPERTNFDKRTRTSAMDLDGATRDNWGRPLGKECDRLPGTCTLSDDSEPWLKI